MGWWPSATHSATIRAGFLLGLFIKKIPDFTVPATLSDFGSDTSGEDSSYHATQDTQEREEETRQDEEADSESETETETEGESSSPSHN